MNSALVPRQLRVRSSVQLAGQRIPAGGFLVIMGVVAVCGLGILVGANPERLLYMGSGAICIGLLVVEGRLWGRSSREVARIVARHVRRPSRLRRGVVTVALPAEQASSAPAARLPRWMSEGAV